MFSNKKFYNDVQNDLSTSNFAANITIFEISFRFKVQISRTIVGTSGLPSQTSRFIVRTSHLLGQTSRFIVRTSQLLGQTSRFIVRTSHLLGQTSRFNVETFLSILQTFLTISHTCLKVAQKSSGGCINIFDHFTYVPKSCTKLFWRFCKIFRPLHKLFRSLHKLFRLLIKNAIMLRSDIQFIS